MALASLAIASVSLADSAIDLVAGFDADRIEQVFPIQNKQSVSESAKLLHRVGKVRPESFISRTRSSLQDDATDGDVVGDAVQFEGVFVEAKSYVVPDTLAEMIGLDSIAVVAIDADNNNLINVIAKSVPPSCKPGDLLKVVGMLVTPRRSDSDDEPENKVAVVAARMTWHPRDAANPSWQWLADHGVDIAELPGLKTRDRRPLSSADTDLFYSIMSAAAKSPPWPEPAAANPIDLLSDPNSLVAKFVTLPVETVQITRVSVTDVNRQRQLGSDHYFQIDTIGDLGNVVVKIESADEDAGGEPAVFENRYPVSIVMLDLPDFLKTAIRVREGGEAVVSDVRVQIQVEGFFFRLWSYETDYMKQFGDEKQFGPLLIAANLQNLESDSPDPLGVSVIGWIAAGLIGISMVGIFLWHRQTAAGDAAIRRDRRDKSAAEIDLSS
ncbi:hypothetical protein [Rubripirellula obstinata]|uniref:hypothetical protein n=1 Tax=Rubripirellula obstinata TaxID=406547 RepID=UPI00082BE1EA|nr:hypothetical protein [Rubripirellula obstinata]